VKRSDTLPGVCYDKDMNNDNPWKTLSSKIVYQNPWIKVREDAVVRPDGSDGIYGVMESKDSVMVVVLNDKNEVFLIRTFSYPVLSWSWELPGGGGEGEDAEIASRRELIEETGIRADRWDLLGQTRVCNGLMTEKMTTFLARNLSFGDKEDSDDKDFISHGKFVSFEEIDEMIEKGKIDDGQTMTGLFLAQRFLRNQ
jgi:8-oxo-dGTP pyrophosphatase MutT (NUDIX family)